MKCKGQSIGAKDISNCKRTQRKKHTKRATPKTLGHKSQKKTKNKQTDPKKKKKT
jgi:hypothetical protein